MGFAELSITSNFTFLTGGSHPEEYARRASLLGIEAIAIADVNSVAGVVRAWSELKKIADEIADRAEAMKDPIGPPKPAHIPDPPRARLDHIPRLLPASCLHLSEGLHLTALPRDRTGWGSLCRVLSVGRLRVEKGQCILHLDDLLAIPRGWSFCCMPPTMPPTMPRRTGTAPPLA
jgi:DNA polymerase III alpha subunit